MAVLSRTLAAGALVATGCYEPQLRDCAVSCATAADCAPDQTCGSDGKCAAPEHAGHCGGAIAASDAGADTSDAAPDARMIDAPTTVVVDAPPMIDAPAQVVLQIEIKDRGAVMVQGAGSCHHTAPNHICQFGVPAGTPRLLTAVPDPEYRFDKWEDVPCIGQDETCTFIPTALFTEIKAKFRRL